VIDPNPVVVGVVAVVLVAWAGMAKLAAP